jgi:D-sedoheptulose 7-phosphate isomerase
MKTEKNLILEILGESLRVKDQCIRQNIDNILSSIKTIASCIKSGNKILIFGNGGSAADAQHIAAEFVNRFKIERPPLAAIALTTDTSIITSIGNDYNFDDIFSKQVQALGKKGDVAIGISTSGNSKNVIEAMHAAKKIGMYTMAMTGSGGELARCSDMVFTVASETTARIQEVHITIAHILCELVDRNLFPDSL